jgi:hypothetical protein
VSKSAGYFSYGEVLTELFIDLMHFSLLLYGRKQGLIHPGLTCILNACRVRRWVHFSYLSHYHAELLKLATSNDGEGPVVILTLGAEVIGAVKIVKLRTYNLSNYSRMLNREQFA